MKLFAAIDLRGGRAVRLVQGDFEREQAYGDPVQLALRFADAGSPWLHVVDLDAARTGEPVNRATVIDIARIVAEQAAGVRVQTGGGVRSVDDVAQLLGAGVARVVLGTAVFEQPDLLARCCERFGTQVALGLDYRRRDDGTMEAAVRGWTRGSGRAVDEFVTGLGEMGLGAVIVTAIERDGTLQGPDLAGLSQVMAATGIPVIASGGVGSAADLVALAGLRASDGAGRQAADGAGLGAPDCAGLGAPDGAGLGAADRAGLAGAIVGRALVDGRLSVEEAIAACAPSG
jgi:phosphoribosylformimino-5-aminoimidazole carboxamide ribotide isomerase